MAARVRSRSQRNANSRLFLLSLGLLIGFIFAFVIFLSRLPVDGSIGTLSSNAPNGSLLDRIKFDYYAHLPEQKVVRKIFPVAAPAPVATDLAKGSPVATIQTSELKSVVNADNMVNANVDVQPPPRTASASELKAKLQLGDSGQAIYFLQAGNFQQADQAERARAAVMMLGLDAFIVVRQDNAGSLGHRVRVGPFHDQSRLLDARERLRTDGIPYQMIRIKS